MELYRTESRLLSTYSIHNRTKYEFVNFCDIPFAEILVNLFYRLKGSMTGKVGVSIAGRSGKAESGFPRFCHSALLLAFLFEVILRIIKGAIRCNNKSNALNGSFSSVTCMLMDLPYRILLVLVISGTHTSYVIVYLVIVFTPVILSA